MANELPDVQPSSEMISATIDEMSGEYSGPLDSWYAGVQSIVAFVRTRLERLNAVLVGCAAETESSPEMRKVTS
jgi:hypothetical protein